MSTTAHGQAVLNVAGLSLSLCPRLLIRKSVKSANEN